MREENNGEEIMIIKRSRALFPNPGSVRGQHMINDLKKSQNSQKFKAKLVLNQSNLNCVFREL